MDFVVRLFARFSHNLLISNCCSYGIEESIQETRGTSTHRSTQVSDDEIEEASFQA